MKPNLLCHGCWWVESGRCFNDNLGLGKAPRNKPIFSGQNGFEITDAHLETCAESGPRGRHIDSVRERLLREIAAARR